MPCNWQRANVGELCEAIIDCVNKTARTVDGPTPFKMIRTTNVKNGWVDTSAVKYVEEDTYKKWIRRGAPRRGDVILTREAPLGEIGLLRDDKGIFLGQRLVMFRADPKKLNNRFLLYALLDHDAQGQIKSFGSGSTVEHMRVPDCSKIEIFTPDLSTQKKIGTILSSYDDLIENNLRRIKILEEMAQNLYREWFVKFRFPGHEKVRFVDSPLGKIPEGWEIKTMPEMVTIRPSVSIPNGIVPFVPMGCLSETSMLINDIETRPKASGARFQNGDTLFARITPCLENGKTGFVQFLPDDKSAACGSTEFIVLRSKTLCPEYVYLMARSDPFRDNAIKSMSGATGRQRVQEECFDKFLIALPSNEILKNFQTITQPQFKMIYSLNLGNQNLRRTRDLLLPKLISGEVDVSELDIAIPEEACA
ncbi:MAG: restriction endonuclease subunit S [Deltaproteobacteria bacterium]|nr:restriction endonuclease subunit S [Deltaproteobacteria bacterium]